MKIIPIVLILLLFLSPVNAISGSFRVKNLLIERCGSRFDGVNATYVAGLKKSLKLRKASRAYPEKSDEIRELKCRIRTLKNLK